ncbi:hypothetical protein FKP32DRAFT_853912 [Trametes sanguinea]|nr:hypothetical protein FKP32DRAFT_853912 [Trametes sanguinea]
MLVLKRYASTLYSLERSALYTIINLRRIYNSKRPPNRLPTEILGVIIESLRKRTKAHTGHLTQPLYDYTDVLSALRVCHRWYEVAIARATLWSYVDFSDDLNGSIRLRRSRAVPLHVRFSLDTYTPEALAELLRTHGPRILELHVWAQSPGVLVKLPSHLNVLANRVENLIVACVERSRSVTLRSLFLGMTPDLKALALQRTPWVPANVFPNLTHLYLSHMAQFPIGILLRLLHNTRVLQLLHLDECEIDISTFDSEVTKAVPMHSLRHLSLGHMRFDPACEVLLHVDLPAAAMLRLYALRLEEGDDAEEAFGDLLLSTPFRITNSFTRLEIVVGHNWRKVVAESGGRESGGFWTDFVHQAGGILVSERSWAEWLLWLPEMVSLSNIQTLHISLFVWDSFFHLASHMPQVRSLFVEEQHRIPEDDPTYREEHDMVVQVCRLLLSDIPMVFPNLQSLGIDALRSLPDPETINALLWKRDLDGRRLSSVKIRVDPSQYTTDYLTEAFISACTYVDELMFVDYDLWDWSVSEVWRVDHDYWELRPSEDPMRFMEHWYKRPDPS